MHSLRTGIILWHRTSDPGFISFNHHHLFMMTLGSLSSTGLKKLLGMMMQFPLWSGIGWHLWGFTENLHIKDPHWPSSDRYLTKIVDQLYCLVSSDHASSLVWTGDVQEALEIDDDEADSLFTFEVMKTNEQEDNVVPQQGFTVRVFLIILNNA